MFVYSRFKGDDDALLMDIQHDVYSKIMAHLFAEAKRTFLSAERMLGQETMLGMIIRPEKYFDHRVLQDAHDIIAAQFRYKRPDFLQPNLDESRVELENKMRQTWIEFYQSEAKRLSQIPEVCRAILEAVAYQNTELGYAAEKTLCNLLKQQYSLYSSNLVTDL